MLNKSFFFNIFLVCFLYGCSSEKTEEIIPDYERFNPAKYSRLESGTTKYNNEKYSVRILKTVESNLLSPDDLAVISFKLNGSKNEEIFFVTLGPSSKEVIRSCNPQESPTISCPPPYNIDSSVVNPIYHALREPFVGRGVGSKVEINISNESMSNWIKKKSIPSSSYFYKNIDKLIIEATLSDRCYPVWGIKNFVWYSFPDGKNTRNETVFLGCK